MSLVSIYEYVSYFGLSSYNPVQIQSYLDYSSQMISTYCDREFEKTDYTEWLESVDNTILTSDYPINRVYFVKPIKTVATMTTTNTAVEQIFEKNDSNVYITLDGVSTNYPLSSYTTIGTLSADLIASGINVVLSDITSTYPTSYLQDITIDLEDCYLIGGDVKNIQSSIDKQSKRIINCNQNGDVLVKYSGGYTFSQDTSAHDALSVAGNVPNDLKSVCINLTKDIAAFTTVSYNANGIPSLLFQKESIGDYSYTRYDNINLTDLLFKYAGNKVNEYISILDMYRKKSFG